MLTERPSVSSNAIDESETSSMRSDTSGEGVLSAGSSAAAVLIPGLHWLRMVLNNDIFSGVQN